MRLVTKLSCLTTLGLCFVLYGPPCMDAIGQEIESTTPLHVGFAATEITPRAMTPMAGYYHKRLSAGTHDPLLAKAMVLSDGETRVAIVSLDLISTTEKMVSEARRLASAETGIPGDAIMISATHSHTGPMLARESTRYSAFGGLDDSARLYMSELPAQISDAISRANSALEATNIRAAIGEERELAFNRRFFMRDGSVGWNPGKQNPNIVRVAGPTDDSIPILAFENDANSLQGIHTNFSIHLDTVGGEEWSADAPFWITNSLQSAFGEDCFVHYTTGCCGDINHVDVRTADRQKGHGEAARIGVRLAAAVLREWPHLEPVPSGRIRYSRRVIELDSDDATPERIEWAREIVAQIEDPDQRNPPFREMVAAIKLLDIEARQGEPWKGEVQVFSIGDQVAWVSLPGEIFVQLGLAIKDASPFDYTIINELAGGSLGYIPTQQAYEQGNYEVISTRLARGSGEKLVDVSIEMLREAYSKTINDN